VIERFDCIPSTIELVRKTPKTYDKWKALKQRILEMFQAYPCKHLGVIKFLSTIDSKTMEANTLSWNGKFFKTWSTQPLWRSECYYNKRGLIWKGENDLSPLSEIMWTWHIGHSWTLTWMYCTTSQSSHPMFW